MQCWYRHGGSLCAGSYERSCCTVRVVAGFELRILVSKVGDVQNRLIEKMISVLPMSGGVVCIYNKEVCTSWPISVRLLLVLFNCNSFQSDCLKLTSDWHNYLYSTVSTVPMYIHLQGQLQSQLTSKLKLTGKALLL
jgi:hypothetical protein